MAHVEALAWALEQSEKPPSHHPPPTPWPSPVLSYLLRSKRSSPFSPGQLISKELWLAHRLGKTWTKPNEFRLWVSMLVSVHTRYPVSSSLRNGVTAFTPSVRDTVALWLRLAHTADVGWEVWKHPPAEGLDPKDCLRIPSALLNHECLNILSFLFFRFLEYTFCVSLNSDLAYICASFYCFFFTFDETDKTQMLRIEICKKKWINSRKNKISIWWIFFLPTQTSNVWVMRWKSKQLQFLGSH